MQKMGRLGGTGGHWRSFETLNAIMQFDCLSFLPRDKHTIHRGTSQGPVSVCHKSAEDLLKRLNVGSQKQHDTIAQEL